MTDNSGGNKGIAIQPVNLIYALIQNRRNEFNAENYGVLSRLKDSLTPLRKFCRKYNLVLTDVSCTTESGFLEPCFAFSDNNGYYTLDSVLKSLKGRIDKSL